jgi:type I restriction enzyme S subunit
MSEKLPNGWAKTKLGEVCLPVATIQPQDSPDTEFTYFDIGGIDNENNRIAETKAVTGRNAPSRARQALRKDDILFSTVRTYLRKIARVDREYLNPVGSTGFAVIRPAEGVSSQLLFCQVLSDDFLQPLHALQSGSSYPAVRARDVFAQQIVLPPAREQERIVSKLSAAFSGVERAETAARRAQERLQRYRTAVLDAAVTGKLTRSWRESQPKGEKISTESGEDLLRRLLLARRALWEKSELGRLCDGGKVPKDEK